MALLRTSHNLVLLAIGPGKGSVLPRFLLVLMGLYALSYIYGHFQAPLISL